MAQEWAILYNADIDGTARYPNDPDALAGPLATGWELVATGTDEDFAFQEIEPADELDEEPVEAATADTQEGDE